MSRATLVIRLERLEGAGWAYRVTAERPDLSVAMRAEGQWPVVLAALAAYVEMMSK